MQTIIYKRSQNSIFRQLKRLGITGVTRAQQDPTHENIVYYYQKGRNITTKFNLDTKEKIEKPNCLIFFYQDEVEVYNKYGKFPFHKN